MNESISWAAWAIGALALATPQLHRRLQLSRAKHRSLAGHSRLARRVVRWIPGYTHSQQTFFNSDGADEALSLRRQAALQRLSEDFRARYRKGIEMSEAAREHIPDMQFTRRYRVPVPYADVLNQWLKTSQFVERTDGIEIVDVDGNRSIDLTGSYGVNVLGHEFYKANMAKASEATRDLGVVLGSYHESVLRNVQRLAALSGLEDVSFHMSGTEAVMQAVRLARYHTGRSHVVRFCGAYHGWWDEVQPGPGNPSEPGKVYTLKDMDERSLTVLRGRRDIACVLINPIQALHPNRAAPGDSALVDSGRQAGFNREAYTRWLQQVRAACNANGIVLILDEVFMGFRLAPGGAQAYFQVAADMVTYGKTLGGGFPVGVVCGKKELMKRYRENRPADLCFARGTFNAHPTVMAAMDGFLQALTSADVQQLYAGLDERWSRREADLNTRLEAEGLPVRVAALSTVWTVTYTTPSRYNWMLQFYLRRHGLALSWVGSGRMVFSLNFSDADFETVCTRFIAAVHQMKADGWWDSSVPLSNPQIRRTVLREMLGV
jgi:glutamate-1-semialdehyde 2,1-aminomutase